MSIMSDDNVNLSLEEAFQKPQYGKGKNKKKKKKKRYENYFIKINK